MLYICIELFEERTLANLKERIDDQTLATNNGDGVVEYAIPWNGTIEDADAAIAFAYMVLHHQGATDANGLNILSPDNPLEYDESLFCWHGRRVHIDDSERLPWGRVDLARAYSSYLEHMRRAAMWGVKIDKACRFLASGEERLEHPDVYTLPE